MTEPVRKQTVPEAHSRSFDPDWSWGLAIFTVVWFSVVIVGAWFFWNAVIS